MHEPGPLPRTRRVRAVAARGVAVRDEPQDADEAHAVPAETRDTADDATGATAPVLPSPAALLRELPAPPAVRETVHGARAALRAALHGRDPERLVVVVGPCSIHDPAAAVEYAARLAAAARVHADALTVVMRTYFEKPRTTLGWTGCLADPHLDDSGDMAEGLRRARRLLLEIGELGLACGSEILDPLAAPSYLADLLAWASVGARTVESQVHRQMASGLPLPVGFKNATDGRLQPAADAVVAAAGSHVRMDTDAEGRLAVRHTAGNPDGHLVLRGGATGPNYDDGSLHAAARAAAELGLARGVLVDCSHGNSGKRAGRQPAVARAVMDARREGMPSILGVMLESHLHSGHQPWSARPLRYGVSVTDACLGWAETEALLTELADHVRELRGAGRAACVRPRGPRVEPGAGAL